MTLIAVDLGGTRIRVAHTDAIYPTRVVREPSAAPQGLEAVLDQIVRMVDEVRGGNDIKAVGVSTPGPLDPFAGIVHDAPNMAGWTGNVPLADLLEDRLHAPVVLVNDANAAAVGEHISGAGMGVDDLVYYTVSTGVGGGIILSGALWMGHNGMAGELGHVTVDPNGPLCGCGNRGCVEAFASGTAIARAGHDRLAAGERSILHGQVTAETVAEAARVGDVLAQSVYDLAGRMLGIGVAAALHSFDPARVVLGGGVLQSADVLLPIVRAEVAKRALPRFRHTPIVRATLGDDAGLIGVAHLAQGAIRD